VTVRETSGSVTRHPRSERERSTRGRAPFAERHVLLVLHQQELAALSDVS
jgi:hypothetical protein